MVKYVFGPRPRSIIPSSETLWSAFEIALNFKFLILHPSITRLLPYHIRPLLWKYYVINPVERTLIDK